MRKLFTYTGIILFLAFSLNGMAGSLSKKETKKVNKILENIWPGDSLQFEVLDLEGIYKKTEFKQFYHISNNHQNLGYFCISSAKGRYDYFDHIVVVDDSLSIQAMQVLTYRSDHGYEITSRKWLSQFNGFTGSPELEYKNDISAISGATISANSITEDVNRIMKLFHYMEQKGLLQVVAVE